MNRSKFDDVLDYANSCSSGGKIGLPTGLSRLDKFTNGIRRKLYDIVFANEGCGKSGFALNTRILEPYNYYIEQKKRGNPLYQFDLQIRLYSLEVDASDVLLKLACAYIYKTKGVLISPSYFSSYKQDSKAIELLREVKPYFDEMLNHLTIIDDNKSSNDIHTEIIDFAKSRGRFIGNRYKPNEANEFVMIIVDTLGNIDYKGGQAGQTEQVNIHTKNCIYYRDKLNYYICNVVHSNSEISKTDRAKYSEIFPKKEDIMLSAQLRRDASRIFCLFNPYEFANPNNNLGNFNDYKINVLQERFRAVGVLKNRGGLNGARIGTMFLGEIGSFTELKKGTDMTIDDYNKVLTIKPDYPKEANKL